VHFWRRNDFRVPTYRPTISCLLHSVEK
jgi:hypothetical protein